MTDVTATCKEVARDKRTARLGIMLLESYLNEHPNEKIIERADKDGLRRLSVVRVPTEREWKAIFDWLDGVKEGGEE